MNITPVTLAMNGVAPDVTLKPYLLDNFPEIDTERRRPLVLILPGGAYEFRSDREAEPIAVRLLGLGLSACVVEYSYAPVRFPAALLQVYAAIAYAREHAEEWHIDPDKILLMGFSAGGHLAASAGVFWHKPHYAQRIGRTPDQVKPNGLVLSYAVITAGEHAHEQSMDNLLDDNRFVFSQTVSLELQVSEHMPPTFLWHTWDDELVPVQNTLLMADALCKAGVPTAVHIFSKGQHGISLSNDQVYGPDGLVNARPDCARWITLFDDWQRGL